MHSFRLLADAVLLHLVQKPLIVLSIVFLLILAVTAVLVGMQLHQNKPDTQQEPAEDDPCC